MNDQISRQKALEIIEKFEFFQGQRAGRELWADKPEEVQERDLANFNRDCRLLKEFINSQPPEDVPDTNVGEITKTQAIEALQTLKEFCYQYVHTQEKTCESCPVGDWCWYDREHITPDDWQIPQERTEE